MSDNAEEGIARTLAAAARAGGGGELSKHHARSVAYLDERIVVFLLAIAVIGLAILWGSAASPLILYGSLVGVTLLTIVWGIARVKRIEAIRRERSRQVASWHSDEQN